MFFSQNRDLLSKPSIGVEQCSQIALVLIPYEELFYERLEAIGNLAKSREPNVSLATSLD